MANYENQLTVIGPKLPLRRFCRIIRHEMAHALAQRKNPFHSAVDHPYSLYLQHEGSQYKRYGFDSGYLAVPYARCLSLRFPALVFNLTFELSRSVYEVYGEGDDDVYMDTITEKSGDFTLVNGETACGYFTCEPVNRYPAWDFDPKSTDERDKWKGVS